MTDLKHVIASIAKAGGSTLGGCGASDIISVYGYEYVSGVSVGQTHTFTVTI